VAFVKLNLYFWVFINEIILQKTSLEEDGDAYAQLKDHEVV